MSKHTTLQQAFDLRKTNQYAEALVLYEPLWQQQPSLFGEWDVWSYGQSLKAVRRYTDALALCRSQYATYGQSPMMRQLYAWCIYYTQLATDPPPASYALYKKAVEAIVQLSPPEQPYSPAVRSVFKIIKHLAVQTNIPWAEIQRWLDLLDVTKLSQDTYAVDVAGKRNPVEMASDVEEWYSWQSKCLLQLQQWEAGVKLCDDATATIKKWHYSNDVWFGRRKVACLVKLGQTAAAMQLLEQLLRRKRDWFMLADMAELCETPAEALRYCAEAGLAYGDADKKVRLFQLMATLNQQLGAYATAVDHALLAMALRQEQAWPIPPELAALATDADGIPTNLPTSKTMLTKLRPQWKQLLPKAAATAPKNERQNGTVYRLLPNGAAGFIQPQNGKETLYFLLKQYKGHATDLQPGLPVSYGVVSSFDAKKNSPSQAAVNIRKREG